MQPPPRRLFRRYYALLFASLVLFIAVGMGLSHSLLARTDPATAFAVFVLLAALLSIIAYPLARHLTGRIERLQDSLARFGAGELACRAAVEGDDEIARLAEHFNQAATRIEQLVAAHRRLLANASHELRTPLTRIRLGIELLGAAADPRRQQALLADLGELDALLEELLLASRLDAIEEAVDRSLWVDLLALAAEACSRYPAVELGYVADAETADAFCLRGDPRLLRRLLRNLLENAHRHGAPPIHLQLQRGVDQIVLTVTDSGPGIAAADRERVFEPFFRCRQAEHNIGSGLGLSLVRQIARHHGGEIDCLASADEGCTFRLRLPLSVDPQLRASAD